MSTIDSSNIGLQTPLITDGNLVGNLDTSAIIKAEMQAYEQPVTNLQDQQSTLNSEVADYQKINTDLQALQSAANVLNSSLLTTSAWQSAQATSSDSSVATASAAAGTPSGSVTFSVSQLAAADSLVSSGTVASTSDSVTSASDFLVAQGAAQLGFSQLASGSGLTLGQHTIDVTQASQAAKSTGTTAFGASSSVTIGSSNDTIDVTANGTAYSVTVASGTYSGQGLASAVSAALASATGGVLQAGLSSSGNMVISSVAQDASQSMQLTGGTALSTLGLSTMSSAASGTDAVVSVDGTSQSISSLAPGQSVTLTGPDGSIAATVSASSDASGASLVSTGSLSATNVSTGNGSLADVVSNINAAGAGITASAIQASSGGYLLELASSATGQANDLSINTSAFSSSGLGTMETSTAGQNAEIDLGGTGGTVISSQNNTFSGLLPGLSVTAASVSSTPVTVTVAPDAQAVAGDVSTMVDAANTVLSALQQYAGYDEATKTGGPLMGSAILQNLTNQIQSIFASVTGTSNLGDAQNLGITLSKGQLSFDKSTFEAAFNANPSEVEAMFTQGGTFAPSSSAYTGEVTLLDAANATASGTYAVDVSQSATQATDAGAVLSSGAVSTAETLTMTMGGESASYTTTAGESLADVAAGINQVLAQNGLAMSASVVDSGDQLQLASTDYGSAASFSVSSSDTASGTTGLAGSTAGTPVTYTGTDVAGTIDGVAATGTGQFLTVPASSSSPAAGLSLQVTASGITSSTLLGSYSYSPGIAQALSSISAAMTDPVTGSITQTVTNLQDQSQGLNSQIAFYTNIAAEEQKMLNDQFSALQATLGSLQDQSQSLSSALSGLG